MGTSLEVSANRAGVGVDMTAWSDANAVTTGGPALVTCAGTTNEDGQHACAESRQTSTAPDKTRVLFVQDCTGPPL